MPGSFAARRDVEGTIFGIDQTAIHDGPGVRMNVYLKGCPLRCLWCHSPESQSPRPEVVWYEARCFRCGKCLTACPARVRSLKPRAVDRTAECTLCGACIAACPIDALEVKGRMVTAGDVADEAARLKPFFRRTGGGVTLTGGEPTAQPDFSFSVASLCGEAGIHVAVETCGHAEWDVLARLAPAVDLFLFDVKHIVADLHAEYTGADNGRILSNLGRLVEAQANVIVRVPLIPEINDDAETVRAMGRRVAELGVGRITLLPFNPATQGKYSWVLQEVPLPGATRQSRAEVEVLEGMLRDEGLEVVPP